MNGATREYTTEGLIQEYEDAIRDARRSVVEHTMYQRVHTPNALAHFMRHHVYAVWDFMSLLKALQRDLTCIEIPWTPRGTPAPRRLVNSIVLDEESDFVDGVATSHFELYLAAMDEVGAETRHARTFVTQVGNGASIESAFDRGDVPLACREFVRATFAVIDTHRPHAIAAAFTIGREDAIPEMFKRLLLSLPNAPRMRTYLERHIDLDGGTHAAQGHALVHELCGHDRERWGDAAVAARSALVARAALWTSIEATLPV
jgi:hypothetical protein